MLKAMRVLLVSPLDPEKPKAEHLKFLMGGENTYTQTLLKYPPKGVEYIHFTEAQKTGETRTSPFQKILRLLTKFRILPISVGTIDIEILGDFDLVHCHAYSLRIIGKKIPVVMSDSSSNFLTLKKYFGWSNWRINLTYFVRKIIHFTLGVYDLDLDLGGYKSLVVFSKFAKRLHIKHGSNSKRIKVIHPGLPVFTNKKSKVKSQMSKVNILFIGIWFRRKGGHILIKAYGRLCKRFPNLKLKIIGEVPKDVNLKLLPNVSSERWVPREKLLNRFYPNADILVLVPPEVEGYGFVVTEAMIFGIPCVISSIGALPELVEHGKSGIVVKPGSVSSLEKALEKLVSDEKLRLRMGTDAKKRFLKRFSIQKSQEQLLRVYKAALSTS